MVMDSRFIVLLESENYTKTNLMASICILLYIYTLTTNSLFWQNHFQLYNLLCKDYEFRLRYHIHWFMWGHIIQCMHTTSKKKIWGKNTFWRIYPDSMLWHGNQNCLWSSIIFSIHFNFIVYLYIRLIFLQIFLCMYKMVWSYAVTFLEKAPT